jgi:hypothetical protein
LVSLAAVPVGHEADRVSPSVDRAYEVCAGIDDCDSTTVAHLDAFDTHHERPSLFDDRAARFDDQVHVKWIETVRLQFVSDPRGERADWERTDLKPD